MKTIHKYPLQDFHALNIRDSNGRMAVSMPIGAVILALQIQDGTPTFWALVDSNEPMEQREFRLVGTGHPLPDTAEASLSPDVASLEPVKPSMWYIGTYQDPPFVWHVFEAQPA